MNTKYEMCRCNHFGGSTPKKDNGHETYFQQGHGSCKWEECECTKFTWSVFCDEHGNIKELP